MFLRGKRAEIACKPQDATLNQASSQPVACVAFLSPAWLSGARVENRRA
jgi:hypothetical protein